MDTNTINHVSLCSGYGGIDLGLKRAIGGHLRTVAFVEIEAFAAANLAAKAEAGLLDNAPIWSDLKRFPWGKFHGLVDILSGGYPCQPFSAAGKRLGAEDPRHLWPYISAGIALMRPSVCFFENVEGHISLGLSDVIEDLGRLGYRTTWGIFSASEVGAPHQRKRIFILAQRIDAGSQGWLRQWPHTQWQGVDGHAGCCGAGVSADWDTWPSRPSEQQFAWEPPRVVLGNAASQRAGRHEDTKWEPAQRWDSVGHASQAVGNAQRLRPQGRDITEGMQEVGASRAEFAGDGCGELANGQRSEWRPDNIGTSGQGDQEAGAAGACGGSMGNAQDPNRWTGDSEAQAGAGPDSEWRRRLGESGQWQTEPSMGLLPDGSADGLGGPNVSGLSDQELAEIRHWMGASTNRTDSLRLLGNGVVPATAERAFRVLVGELMEAAP